MWLEEPSASPTQPTLRRLRQFGVRPDRELGQNFLIDSNILGVIGRLAELSDADVVLEIGGGWGCSPSTSPQRAAHVHVVEIDERLCDPLERRRRALCQRHAPLGRRADGGPRGDAPRAHEGDRQPPLRRRRQRAAAHDRGAAHRYPLGGDGAARGRRAARRRAGRPRLRGALRARPARLPRARRARDPPHRLSSRAQRGLRAGRADPHRTRSPRPALRALVAGAFAHRRKALARSLALAGVAAQREQVRAALASWGSRWMCAPSGCPRRSSWRWRRCWECAAPANGVRLDPAHAHPDPAHLDPAREMTTSSAGRSASAGVAPLPLRALAPAKINLGLFLGPTRADGRHELATRDAVDLAGGRAHAAGRARPRCARRRRGVSRGGRARPTENLAAAALAAFRAATGWDAPPLQAAHRQARPRRRRPGRRLGRRRRRAAPRRRRLGVGRP